MRGMVALVLVSFGSSIVSADMESYARRREKGAVESIRKHTLRAHDVNDRNARYSPHIDAEDGRGKGMLYLISKDGHDRRWVDDHDYEVNFRALGYLVEVDRVLE